MLKTDLKTRRRPGRPRRFVPGPVLGYERGFPIVPVTWQRSRRGDLLLLAACPYCARPHTHGGGAPGTDAHDYEGHRVAHCDPRDVPADRQDEMRRGYILRIVGEEPTSGHDTLVAPHVRRARAVARRHRLSTDIEHAGGWPAVLERIENGETVPEIARSFNVSRQLLVSLLYENLDRYKLVRQAREAAAAAREEIAARRRTGEVN